MYIIVVYNHDYYCSVLLSGCIRCVFKMNKDYHDCISSLVSTHKMLVKMPIVEKKMKGKLYNI